MAALVRQTVGLLGGVVVAAQAVELSLPVEGSAGPGALRRVIDVFARLARLGHRIGPGTPQLHDLRSVDHAVAPERHHVGLGVAPARKRRRPLLRPPDVHYTLTGFE